MPSIDGDISMTDSLGRNQDLENIEQRIIKVEKQESAHRGTVVTPAKPGAASRFTATPATTNRLIASIEADESYDPVTPSKSLTRGSRGKGTKRAESQSPKKAASAKASAGKVVKTRQSPKKKDTKPGLKNPQAALLGETIAEDDDNGEDWEDENDDARSDENTWSQVNKVIGSTGKPTHPNGRAEGRKLVSWHRTRMMEKLILHIVFECRRADINLPWDKIAHRLCPGSSGAAAQQYINKMRDVLITEGHLVPPPLGKKAVLDPSIRGYIRDTDAEDPKASRSVGWLEEIVDLKESLVVPGVSRGSGTYRRDKTRWQSNKATIGEETPTKIVRARARPDRQLSKSTPKPKEKVVKIKKERSESLDPAEMPSDDDYDPRNRLKIKGHRKRKVKVKNVRKYETDDDMDKATESENESFGYSDDETYLIETPSKKKGSGNDLMTSLAALPVTLKLSPDLLSKFPGGLASKSVQDMLAGTETEDDGCTEEDHDDSETAAGASTHDGDDVFGPKSFDLNNIHGFELQTQALFPPNNYVRGMNYSCNFYSQNDPMSAHGYTSVYTPTCNNHNFSNVQATSFDNTYGGDSYPNDMFLGMQNFNPTSGIHDGLNFGGSNETMHDMNGSHDNTSSFIQSTEVSSSNSSFAQVPANAEYDRGVFNYANASSIVPSRSFETPDADSWVEQFASNVPFKHDGSL
ncbi:86875ef8-fbb7-4a25-8321-d80db1094877 [Sclerotinia trifoliorum]|uniref:86875ef8-fbb7-4a25-8321-d80db1094877 n=1 Tax=Sclerotinia trifoliorum TaxID=28548 RepID=A0A8H2W5U7_9HELO|nr:86875ef8-fbb7-4a25-8321-d80db1094877 [Sclerotinia trifoliorum]